MRRFAEAPLHSEVSDGSEFVAQKPFDAHTTGGEQTGFGGVFESSETKAVGDCGGVFSPHDSRADGEMEFVDETCAEKRIVQRGAAFRKNHARVILAGEYVDEVAKVDFALSANDEASELRKCPATSGRSGFAACDDEGRDAGFENGQIEREIEFAGDDDTDGMFGLTSSFARSAKMGPGDPHGFVVNGGARCDEKRVALRADPQ